MKSLNKYVNESKQSFSDKVVDMIVKEIHRTEDSDFTKVLMTNLLGKLLDKVDKDTANQIGDAINEINKQYNIL